eukprot:5379080-Pyramimonas_sp.AAC.1
MGDSFWLVLYGSPCVATACSRSGALWMVLYAAPTVATARSRRGTLWVVLLGWCSMTRHL